jgi:hypothetical protein
MKPWLMSALGWLIADVAVAAPTVVWLQPELPPAEELDRADHKTGGTEHITALELAFPAEPWSDVDTQHLADVQEAVENAFTRWNDFEVELPIATDLGMTLDSVTALRDERDLSVLISALLLQGSAVVRAFEPTEFGSDARAADWRVVVDGAAVPKPWVDAWALAGVAGRSSFLKTDFVDAAAWADWQRLSPAIAKLEGATLTWDARIGEVFIDGKAASGGSARVRPGQHRVHVLRDGAVSGRSTFEVAAGATTAVPGRVSEGDLESARQLALAGSVLGMPASVEAGLEALARSRGGPLYLGALDEGKAGVVEWGVGARLLERSVFTAVLTADMGGGIQMSSLYEEADGDSRLAGAMSGGFGFDLGFSYFLLNLGMDVSVTPGSTVQFANNDGDDNVAVSVFPQPHAGIGVYFLRPIADTPTLSLQGDVSWVGPAHLAYGGRIAVGVPIDAKKNWFRVVVGGSYGPSTLWKLPEDPVSMTSAWLRVGVGSRL